MATRQEITDEQWAVLAPLFPSPKGRGRPPMDMRTTVEGIAWRFRTGAPWRDLPDRFGKWNSIYQRFSDWSADGTWARLLATVQGAAAANGEVEWTVSVDSTITRVHQHGATLARDTGGWIELHESLRTQRQSRAACPCDRSLQGRCDLQDPSRGRWQGTAAGAVAHRRQRRRYDLFQHSATDHQHPRRATRTASLATRSGACGQGLHLRCEPQVPHRARNQGHHPRARGPEGRPSSTRLSRRTATQL